MDFKIELENMLGIINEKLLQYVKTDEIPEKGLNNAVSYALISNAKRLRPILMIETYKIFKQDIEKCIPYAVAMEMIHNFSLIHDDLPGIDDDSMRHGKPTVHRKFNESTAILAGDSLLNYAYTVMIDDIYKTDKSDVFTKIEIIKEISQATDRMIAGEYVDTEYERKAISSEYLEYMDKNKTGALLKASVRVGAILAKCNNEELQLLTEYAESIGLAFQIKDDILSEIGNEAELGKPVGNDKIRGKSTYVSKYGLETAQKMLTNEIETAITKVKPFGEKAEFLIELAKYIKDRKK